MKGESDNNCVFAVQENMQRLTPMKRLPVLTWTANAATVLCGRRGAVTAQAKEAGCSRQATYDQARCVEQAVTAVPAGEPDRGAEQAELAALLEENRQRWQALDQAVDFPLQRQQRLTAEEAARVLSRSVRLKRGGVHE
jgi:hypothetical protein